MSKRKRNESPSSSSSESSLSSSDEDVKVKTENLLEPIVVIVDGAPSESDLLEEITSQEIDNEYQAKPKRKGGSVKGRKKPLTLRDDADKAERARQRAKERRQDESVRQREREKDRERKRRKREEERQDEETYKASNLEKARQRQAKRREDQSFREKERARDRERKRLKRAMEKMDKDRSDTKVKNQEATIIDASPPYNCSHCSLSFQIRSKFLLHELSHFIKINCPVCSQTIFEDQLQRHLQQHSMDTSIFICDLCGKSFLQKIQILDHICSDHLLAIKQDCSICSFSTYCENLMKLHISSHDSDEVFCDLCGMNFKMRKEFNSHMMKVHNTGFNSQCEMCGKQFKVKTHLTYHQKAIHGIMPEESSATLSIQCDLCGQKFTSKSGLTLHQKRKHEGKQDDEKQSVKNNVFKPFVCSICMKAYRDTSTLNAHISRCHIDKSGELACEDCDFVTTIYSRLKHHRYTHHNKKIICNICGKGFSCQSQLNKHVEGVHGEKKYECNLCGLKVSHPAYLRRHMNERHSKLMSLYSLH
jgi:flagellar biosynthesis GTPase FlhF